MFLFRKSSACLVGVVAVASACGLSCKSEQPKFHACATEAVTAYVDGVIKDKKPVDESEARWCAPRTFAGGVTADL